jgi:hypothetical protein
MGFGLLLSGIGFLVLTLRVLRRFGDEKKPVPAPGPAEAALTS